MTLYLLSLNLLKKHKQIPISITPQKAACKATKINLILSIL